MPPSHTCPDCSKTFTKKDHLTRHIRSHRDERPYVCEEESCQRRFARSDALARHRKIHANKPLPPATSGVEVPAAGPAAPPAASATPVFTLPGPSDRTDEDGSESSVPLAGWPTALSSSGQAMGTLTTAPLDDMTVMASMPEGLQGHAGEEGWAASLIDDLLRDFPLFGEHSSGAAFMQTLNTSNYFNSAPSHYASPLMDFKSLSPVAADMRRQPDSAEGHDGPRLRDFDNIAETFRRLCPYPPSVDEALVERPYAHGFDPMESVREELRDKRDSEQIVEPSSAFLEAALQCFWHQIHPLVRVLHRATFDTREHHPLLLLAMCASGASVMSTEASSAFAASVFRRIHATLPSRWQRSAHVIGLRQRHDLLLSALLCCRYGLSQGERWMTDVAGLHSVCLAWARQSNIFARNGAYSLFKNHDSLPVTEQLYGLWLAQESSTRLANAILLLDCELHTAVRDSQAPLPIAEVQLALPCPAALFDAPSAEAWTALAGPTLTANASMPALLWQLYDETDSSLIPLQSVWQAQAALFAAYTVKRCRWMHHLPNPNARLRDTFDRQSFLALRKWHASFKLLPGDQSRLLLIPFEALMQSWCADLEMIGRACGVEGSSVTVRAIDSLYAHWWPLSSARRAVLHAGQVLRHLAESGGSPTLPHHVITAAHQAVVTVWAYSVLSEYHHHQHTSGLASQEQSAFCLTEPYDIDTLGEEGTGLIDHAPLTLATEPLSPAAAFIRHGGDAVLFKGQPTLSTFAGRSMALTSAARHLNSVVYPAAEAVAKSARCLAQAELLL